MLSCLFVVFFKMFQDVCLLLLLLAAAEAAAYEDAGCGVSANRAVFEAYFWHLSINPKSVTKKFQRGFKAESWMNTGEKIKGCFPVVIFSPFHSLYGSRATSECCWVFECLSVCGVWCGCWWRHGGVCVCVCESVGLSKNGNRGWGSLGGLES